MNVIEISDEENKKLEEEFTDLTDSYYLSVKNRFEKTVKQKKLDKYFSIFFMSFIMLSSIAVFISLQLIFNTKIPWDIEIEFSWSLFLIIFGTFLYLFVISIATIFLNNKIRKGTLRGKKLAFCYLYSAIKEMKTHLVNGDDEHLDAANYLFSNYVKESEINFILEVKALRAPEIGGTNTEKKETNLGSIIESISNQYWWFELSEKTKNIIDAYKDLIPKIGLRIKHKIEIEKILPPLTKLMFYEYSKTSRISSEQLTLLKNYTLDNLGRNFLINSIDDINSLHYPVIRIEAKYPYFRIFKNKVLLLINNCLNSKNILVGFLSWYLLLFVVFSISVFIAARFVKIDIDSTIIIGLFSAPFAGAILVSSAIYTKSK